MANTQPISDPVGVDRYDAAAIGLSAADHRRGMGALAAPSTGATSGNRSGVFPGGTAGPGVSNDLQGSWLSGMTIRFNAGHFGVDRGAGAFFEGFVYSAIDITLDAGDPSNPRYDYIVLRQRDPGGIDATMNPVPTETAKVIVLKGAAAASPLEPGAQMTSGDLLLHCQLVPAGATALSVSAVTAGDRRKFIVARGGINLRRDGDDTPGAYEGDCAWNVDLDQFEAWSTTLSGAMAWQPIASPAVWRQWTPKLYSSAGQCNLGSGGSAKGFYMLNGTSMHLRSVFRATRPCNLGYGSIYSTLPPGFSSAPTESSHILAKLNAINGSVWLGETWVPEDQSKMIPYFPGSSGDCRIGPYQVADQQGVPGKSIPNVGNDYADPFFLIIQGTIEIQR